MSVRFFLLRILRVCEEILCLVNKSMGHQSFYKTQHGLLLNQFTASHVIPIYILLQSILKCRTKYCRVGGTSSVAMHKQMSSALRCTVRLSTTEWGAVIGTLGGEAPINVFGVQLDNPHYHSMYCTRGKAMANYPQELAQDAVCQSHTGHMTGLWFLPARPLRLNTNE